MTQPPSHSTPSSPRHAESEAFYAHRKGPMDYSEVFGTPPAPHANTTGQGRPSLWAVYRNSSSNPKEKDRESAVTQHEATSWAKARVKSSSESG